MHINDLGDGRFELVETRIIRLGVLTNRRVAERFADFLDQMDEHEREQLVAFTDGVPGEDLEAPADDCELARPSQDLASAAEPLMAEAYARLEDGEKLGLVADDLGISMPKLRGSWARHIRVKGTMTGSAEAISCATCGRSFRPGSSGTDTCARCSRDLGRV